MPSAPKPCKVCGTLCPTARHTFCSDACKPSSSRATKSMSVEPNDAVRDLEVKMGALDLTANLLSLVSDALTRGERGLCSVPDMRALLLAFRDQGDLDPLPVSSSPGAIIEYIRGLEAEEWSAFAEELAPILFALTDVSGEKGLVENIPFAFDTETTGLDIKSCHILDICIKDLSPGAENCEFETLVNPGDTIYIEANISGISRQTLLESDAPSTKVMALSLCVWLLQRCLVSRVTNRTKNNRRLLLIAHNAQFDARFLATTFLRTNLPLDSLFSNWSFLCTCSVAKTLLKKEANPGLENHRLQTLGSFFNVVLPGEGQAHRARYDTLVLTSILGCLVDLAPEDAELPFLRRLSRWQRNIKSGHHHRMSDSVRAVEQKRINRGIEL